MEPRLLGRGEAEILGIGTKLIELQWSRAC